MGLLLFVRSTDDLAPACRDAGKFQAPAGAPEQRHAHGFFQCRNLATQGLWQVQPFTGALDAARLGHGPEVMKLQAACS